MTNNEMINSMGVEEKAKFFTNKGYCDLCSQNRTECDFRCVNNISEWLKQENSKSDSCYNCNKSYDMGCSECEKYYENEGGR